MTISEATLSETIVSMVPGNRFRMLLLMTRLGFTFSRILIRPSQIAAVHGLRSPAFLHHQARMKSAIQI